MNKEIDVKELAESALNAAIKHIQDAFGQTDGGYAGLFFDKNRTEPILATLETYAMRERANFEERPFVEAFFEECSNDMSGVVYSREALKKGGVYFATRENGKIVVKFKYGLECELTRWRAEFDEASFIEWGKSL